MITSDPDPHAERPTQWIGKTARFTHEGRNLSGVVFAVEYVGRCGPSQIPDYRLAIKGASGATLLVSMFDTYATIDD